MQNEKRQMILTCSFFFFILLQIKGFYKKFNIKILNIKIEKKRRTHTNNNDNNKSFVFLNNNANLTVIPCYYRNIKME